MNWSLFSLSTPRQLANPFQQKNPSDDHGIFCIQIKNKMVKVCHPSQQDNQSACLFIHSAAAAGAIFHQNLRLGKQDARLGSVS